MNKDINSKAKKGFKWAASSSIYRAVISAGTTFTLAALLGTEEYGYFALISTLITFSTVIANMGMSQAIIQEDKLTNTDIDTVFWGNILFGTVVGTVVYIFAKPISLFLGDIAIYNLVRMSAIIFVIHTMSRISAALLQRDLRIKELEKAIVIEMTIASIVKIICALSGLGAMSFIIGQIIGIIILNILLFVYYKKEGNWKLKLNFSLSSAKKLYKFGMFIATKSIVNNLGKNIDIIIVSRVVGVESVGIYHLGKQAIEKAVSIISQVVTRIAYPYFSKIRRSIVDGNYQSLAITYLKLTGIVSFLGFPFFLGIALFGPEILPMFFSKEWNAAGIILTILSFKAMIDILSAGFASSIIYSFGLASLMLYVDLVITPIRIILLWIGAYFWGIEGVAFAFTISVFIKASYLQQVVNRSINIAWNNYLIVIAKPFFFSILAFIVSKTFLINLNLFVLSKSIVAGLIYLGIILILSYLFDKNKITEVKKIIF